MALPSRLHRAVLVDPARPMLRVATLDQRWVEHAELTAALGVGAAWRCAPSRWEDADTVVHLLVGSGPLPEDGWVPDHDPAALAGFSAETAAWLRSAYDGWRAGTLAVPGQPWWSASWAAEVTTWIDDVLQPLGLSRTGEPVPTKMWSLSAVLRVPTSAGRDLWFKATCDWFHAEPALTAVVASLAPSMTPDVVAVDTERAWMLLEELPDADAEPAHLAVPVAAGMAALQLAAPVSVLVEAGLERRSLAGLVGELHRALHESVLTDRFTEEQWASWREVEPWLVEQVEALDALGLPDALNHGDLHLGNVAGVDEPIVFDWTDACLTHPYLDARHLANEVREPGAGERVWAAWSEPWRAAYPQVDHDLAWSLTPAVETAFQLATYERIFRAQDPDSRGDLLSVVPWLHDRLREAHDAARQPR